MRKRSPQLLFLLFSLIILSSCISPKDKVERAKLLKNEDAETSELLAKINNLARINSLRAKMDLKFEDNSYAEIGIAEKYKTADGEIVVQRPANILLKVQLPVIKSDVAQMTSNGTTFRVAILQDGGDGRYRKFVTGTNAADYSLLQEKVRRTDFDNGAVIKQNVNAFANLRPQHFTDAMLVRPVDPANYSYLTSTIYQEEYDFTAAKKSPLRWVLRGYYLVDELAKSTDGQLRVIRRFWFDRVGGIRLARQQIFDARGEIDSDIVYGQEGSLGASGEFQNMPLQVSVTRPKEKYKMRLTYQTPAAVSIGKTYPLAAFELENSWGLEQVDLDKKLEEARAERAKVSSVNGSPASPQTARASEN